MGTELRADTVVADHYELVSRLGEGGMGIVWSARHRVTNDRCALKFVKTSGSREQARRLMREAKASGVIRHSNVRQIFDVIEAEDGSPIIVMELLEGRTLTALLDTAGRLSLGHTARIALPVLSALRAAHALGIIHRDLKPENIFLVDHPAPDVKVVDFGLAKLTATEGAASPSTAITSTGAVVGTLHYMAPEQLFGEKKIDHRVDVWALGLVMYRMLSGTLPTEAENIGQVMKLIVAEDIAPLAQVAPHVPPPLAAAVDRMLARSAAKRLSDLQEVVDALQPHADGPMPVSDGRRGPLSRPREVSGEVAISSAATMLAGDAPGAPRQDHRSDGLWIGTWRNVVIQLWGDGPTIEALEHTRASAERMVKRFPDGYLAISLIMTTRLPRLGEYERQRAIELIKIVKSSIKLNAQVVEGGGFAASGVRAILAGVNMFQPGAKVFDDVPTAASWLVTRGGAGFEAAELTRAVDLARADWRR